MFPSTVCLYQRIDCVLKGIGCKMIGLFPIAGIVRSASSHSLPCIPVNRCPCFNVGNEIGSVSLIVKPDLFHSVGQSIVFCFFNPPVIGIYDMFLPDKEAIGSEKGRIDGSCPHLKPNNGGSHHSKRRIFMVELSIVSLRGSEKYSSVPANLFCPIIRSPQSVLPYLFSPIKRTP